MSDPKNVFVTGATGFLAKHIVLQLLNAGHSVTGSLRDLSRAQEVRDAVAPGLRDADRQLARLRFVALDLTRDDGWAEALGGSHVLMHTASPFPIEQPKDPDELIRPAVDGTLRALKAARQAGVGRVVLTSSTAAVISGTLRAGQIAYDETNWTDLSDPDISAYVRSKTMAERAAWDFIASGPPDTTLTVINPGFIVGPPLDDHFGSSIGVVRRILRGKDPMSPAFSFSMVDVRDVAEMHLRVMERPEDAGKRYLAVAGSMWMAAMAKTLQGEYPDRKLPTRTAPNFVMRLLGLFDAQIRSILPELGRNPQVSNHRARTDLGMKFRPPKEALVASARYLTERDLV